MKRALILLYVIFFHSSTFANSLGSKLNVLPGILPGSANQKQVTEVFGKPNRVTDLKDLAESSDSGPLWEYLEGGGVRFSISFEPQGPNARGWVWTVLDGDAERDLRTALNRFPDASWEAETSKWVNPHQVPMECYFKDKKHGISIEYSRARKKVTSISRWNPERKVSSSEDEKPPRYCIENACADAKLSKDVFKDNPLCVVPK